MSASNSNPERRVVPVALIETTPSANGLGHWLLASPFLVFLLWFWGDAVAYLSPLPDLLDWMWGTVLFAAAIVLPLGYAAHWIVTALPRPFQHAGWDVQPLAPIAPNEQYLVRYRYQERTRAPTDGSRILMRAGQGWVYLEIAAIFIGAIVMIPLFLSATEFGFGR